ncbi:MAG TPA: hypothetical protein VFS65_01245 [Candidatus Saccharimonadales bacterium]|nr:hypothetical protein [Candidatus Saccharimonadales bacterium]
MGNRRFVSNELPIYHLPPPEVVVADLHKNYPIETPLDERGLVDVPKLLVEMSKTVDPNYDWRSQFNDVHHLQWPNRWYDDEDKEFETTLVNPNEFRSLAIGKWVLPRVLHNWIHKVTEPPKIPDMDTMHYRIEAQRVTTSLFLTARSSKRIWRSKFLTEKQIQNQLMQRFDTFSTQLEDAKSVPANFQLIDLPERSPQNIDDMFDIGAKLGKYAVAGTVRSAMRIMKQARNAA